MNNLLLPDLFAMVVLLAVLWQVRRRYPQNDIRLWMAGLLLILLECVARILYGIHLPEGPHRVMHVIALDSYLLAGILFLRSSLRGMQRLPHSTLYASLYTAPGLLLVTGYGVNMTGTPFYLVTAIAGITITAASSLVLRRPGRYLGLVLVWVPVLAATLAGSPRLAVYLLLAGLYLATAGTFAWSLPRRSSGKLAVVTGFVVWAACFATHPWIAQSHRAWTEVASEIWNLQKFLITVGFLLVLFERQVENNEWLALHDQLTGLPNRRLFQDRLGNAIARAERDRTALILFYLDLNHFKEVNDTLGHDAGDELLRKVSESLHAVVRRTDTLARMGGDEFMLLATDVRGERAERKERRWLRMQDGSPERQAQGNAARQDESLPADDSSPQDGTSRILQHARRIEQNIRGAVDKPVKLWTRSGSRTVQVSASVGIAVYPNDSVNVTELCRIADQRMYEDKGGQKASRGGLDRVLSLLTTN